MDDATIFLTKAEASLAGAESEMENRRFDNCANRSYYACFQAAIAALFLAGFSPSGNDGEWTHSAVQAQFVGQLINRRKRYPASLRGVLAHNMELRHIGDYGASFLGDVQARRSIARARNFVAAVKVALEELS